MLVFLFWEWKLNVVANADDRPKVAPAATWPIDDGIRKAPAKCMFLLPEVVILMLNLH